MSHWTDETANLQKFWATVKRDGTDEDAVHEALGVGSVKDYKGTMEEALAEVRGWVRAAGGKHLFHHNAEAPASLNFRYDFSGYSFQITARAGDDWMPLMDMMSNMINRLGQLGGGKAPAQASPTPSPAPQAEEVEVGDRGPVMCFEHNATMIYHKEGKFGPYYSHEGPQGWCYGRKWCPAHNDWMKLKTDKKGSGEAWYSHKLSDGTYCNGGKPQDADAPNMGPLPDLEF